MTLLERTYRDRSKGKFNWTSQSTNRRLRLPWCQATPMRHGRGSRQWPMHLIRTRGNPLWSCLWARVWKGQTNWTVSSVVLRAAVLELELYYPPPPASVLNIRQSDVRHLFSLCNPRKSPGPANICGSVLKHCAEQLAPVLWHHWWWSAWSVWSRGI